MKLGAFASATAVALIATGVQTLGSAATAGSESAAPTCGAATDLRSGAVFTLLNLQPSNQVLVYARAADGSLCPLNVYDTGGTSDHFGALVSGQDALIADGTYLLATSPGSTDPAGTGDGTVSVFRIEADRLVLTDVEPSGGTNPRSVARQGNLVYVVNAGSDTPQAVPETVQGYRLDTTSGSLIPIPGSLTPTLDPHGDPAQIGLTIDARTLVISQRHSSAPGETQRFVEIMNLGAEGVPTGVSRFEVGGDRPFGFRIGPGDIMYLTHGQLPDGFAGGISAHQIQADGVMVTRSPFIADGAGETCWNYLSRSTSTPYMYTSAFFDSAIGLARIEADGSLALVDAHLASSATSGGNQFLFDAGGVDIHGTVDASGTEYLYVLNNPIPDPLALPIVRIVGFRINPADGTLIQLGNSVASGIPNSGFGLWTL